MSVFSVIGAIVALILALIKVYEWSHFVPYMLAELYREVMVV